MRNFNRKAQLTITVSSLPLILAKLVEFFSNLKVVLLVLFNEFLGLFILRDFELSTNNNNMYSNDDKDDQFSNDFYNDNDFDIYQNIELVEKFLHRYKTYFLNAYREIWDTFFSGLLFDRLDEFLGQTLELCGDAVASAPIETEASNQQNLNYLSSIGILRVLLMFRKCITNQYFKKLIIDGSSSREELGKGMKSTSIAGLSNKKQIKENLTNTKKKTNELVDYYYYHITAHNATNLYHQLNKLLLHRFLPLKDAVLTLQDLGSSVTNSISGINTEPKTILLSFSQLPDLRIIDIETFSKIDSGSHSSNNSDPEKTCNINLLLQKLDYSKEFKAPLEIDVWENGLPVLPSTDFTLLLFKFKENWISGAVGEIDNKVLSELNLDLFRNPAFRKFKNHVLITMLLQFQQTLKLVENVYYLEKKLAIETRDLRNDDSTTDVNVETIIYDGKTINNNSNGTLELGEEASHLSFKSKLKLASSSDIITQKALLSFADMCYLLKFISIDSGSDLERLVAGNKYSLNRISKHASSSFTGAATATAADTAADTDYEKTKNLLSDIDGKFITRNVSDYFN